MKKIITIVVMLTLVLSIVGCKRTNRPDFKKADFRLAAGAIAEDLDLHTTSMANDFLILGNTMEGLFRLGEGDSVVDGIAKVDQTTISENATVYTFKLREGALWSNGDEVTANDFVYSWQRAVQKHDKYTVAYASMFFVIENAEEIYNGTETDVNKLGIVAKDNYTLEVTLTKPVPYFMQLMAFPSFFPAHKETVEEYAIDYGKSTKALIFNGPFTVTYWNTDYGIYLEKNDKYWDKDSVKINSLSYRLVEDPNTLITLYDNNEIDRVGITGSQYEDRADDPNILVEIQPVTWYLVFNTEDTNFSNENLRKFMQYAIDKKELVYAMQPYVATDAYVPRGYSTILIDNESVDYRDFATDNWDASKILDEENFNKFDDTHNGIFDANKAQDYLDTALTELGVTSLEVNFKCFDTEAWTDLFENIQFQLSEYDGITINLDKKPGGDVYASYDANEYEFGFYGWGPDYPDPMSFLELYHSEDSHNILKDINADPLEILNSSYDELIESARDDLDTLADPVLRYEKFVEAEEILLENAYIVPLANRAGGVLVDSKVNGIITHNFGPDSTYKWVEITE